jgi:diguanylate cyclase (GGDEF)-like protein
MSQPEKSIAARLTELAQSYLANLQQSLDALQQVVTEITPERINSEQLEQLHHELHRIAGAAGTFGLPALGALARQQEMLLSGWLQGGTIDASDLSTLRQSIVTMRSMTTDPELARRKPVINEWEEVTHDHPLIYLVTRDQQLADELLLALQNFGYRVSHFDSIAVLMLREREVPDTLVVEFSESCDEILSHLPGEWAIRVPLFFLSNDNSASTRLRAARAGAQGYFLTPIDIPRLVDRIEQIIERQNAPPYRILLVDDNELLASHYQLVLEASNMEVAVVHTPDDVHEILHRHQPELILLDIYLPGIYSGTDIARMIRMQDEWVSVPIVFLSGESDPYRQHQAMDSGGDDFLTKPIADYNLVAAVRVRAQRARELNRLLASDSLTGLLRHARFKERLAMETLRARRTGLPMTIAMIDIDHFKRVNDNYGHAMGDRVIKALAHLMRQRLRRSDILGRYGGEEFAVVLPECNEEDALRLLDNLREAFQAIHFSAESSQFYATVSIGICGFRSEFDAEQLLELADQALYTAKQNGRNRVKLTT